LGTIAAEQRDFLDSKPIHRGDQLQLWIGDEWIFARYETASYQNKEVVLYSVDTDRWLDRATMLFRWPERE
jgi:hypothetical protein